MADRSFEMRLERLFADTPAFADADLFALGLEERLDRGRTLRQILIGGLGLVGGVIGAGQVLGTGIAGRLIALANQSQVFASARVAHIAAGRILPSDFPVNGELFFISAALAVVAAGFTVARVLREI